MTRHLPLVLALLLSLWPGVAAAQDAVAIQRALNTLGFAVGAPDGDLGQRSRSGIAAFQQAYGYRVSGALTEAQKTTLMDLGRIVRQQTGPRTRDGLRPGTALTISTPPITDPIFFANGAHYALAQMWRYDGPPSDTDMARFERIRAAQGRLLQRALAEARETGRAYPLALVTLAAIRVQGREGLPTPPAEALDRVVTRALRQGDEPAVVNTAIWAFGTGAVPINCAEQPDGAGIAALAAALAPQVADHPDARQVFNAAAECTTDPAAALAHRAAWTAAARDRDPATLAGALLAEGEARLRAGDTDAARPLFAEMHAILSDRLPGEYRTSFTARTLAGTATIRMLWQVGLTAEARDAAEIFVRNMTGPDSSLPQNEIGDATIWGEALFEEARDISGVLVAVARPRTIRAWSRYLSEDDEWFALWIGLGDMLIDGFNAEAISGAERLVPWFLKQDLPDQATALAVTAAEAALNLGRFDVAEAWIDAAITHAARLDHDRYAQRIETILSRLGLSSVEAVSPGTALGNEIKDFISLRCDPDRDDTAVGPYRPLIDHYAVVFDPGFRRDLIATDVRAALADNATCTAAADEFTRLECHLSARAGDLQAVRRILDTGIRPVGRNRPGYVLPGCVAGLADAGRLDLLAPYSDRLAALEEAEPLWLASLVPDDRPAAIARLVANWKPRDGIGWDLQIVRHLAPLSASERAALQESFRGTYLILNAGANLRGYEEAEFFNGAFGDFTAAMGYGLPDLAEAYLAVDHRILPAMLPITAADEVAAILADAGRLRLVEAHARVAIARGDTDRARAILSPFADALLDGFDTGSLAVQGRIEQVALSGAPLLSLWIGLAADRPEDAPQIFRAQQALALAGSQASLSALDARIASADPDLARAYQDARRQLRALRADPEVSPAAVAAASDTLAAREADLAQVPMGEAGTAMASVLDADAARDRLAAAGAGLLIATQLPDALVLTWVDGTGLQQRSLPMSEENLSSRVAAFRSGITASTRETDRFDRAEARAIHSDLFGWIAGPLPDRIFLVLDDPLTSLPAAALLTPDGTWFGAAHRVRTVPSVGWIAAADGARPAGAAPFLGFGAPQFSARALPALPETEAELRFLAAALGADPVAAVHVGAAANPAQIAALNADGTLAEAAVLSFATHGLLGGEPIPDGPSTAALALSPDPSGKGDAYLAAPEIFDLRLNARLVILSACNTGTPGAGAGLSELAAGFIYAGAQSLLVSHWAVDSAATVELMRNIALGTAADAAAPADAILRDTIATLSAEGTAWDHPRYWAAFFILG